MSATDQHWLIDQLATFPLGSIEIQLRRARAYLDLTDLEKTQGCLDVAERILDKVADYDWCMAWHRGLLALTNGDIDAAKSSFFHVYCALTGEDAPKLALGFCYEELGRHDDAERCYDAVWRRERSQASAAFDLVRIRGPDPVRTSPQQ